MNNETAIIELENVRDHLALAESQLRQLKTLFSTACRLKREGEHDDQLSDLLELGQFTSWSWADNMNACLSDVDDRLKRVTA